MEYAQEEIVILFFMREKKENFLLRLVGTWSIAAVGARGGAQYCKSLQVNP